MSKVMTVHDARMAFKWSNIVSGVFGLADVGPVGYDTDDTRFSARVAECEVDEIVAVIKSTPRAEAICNEIPADGR
jgi:hypothetical protein